MADQPAATVLAAVRHHRDNLAAEAGDTADLVRHARASLEYLEAEWARLDAEVAELTGWLDAHEVPAGA